MAGRTMATLLAPVATLMTAAGAGRSLFFAMERSRPWKLTQQDARPLLLNFADPLISMQSPRFLTFIPHAQFKWLHGLSHVPISYNPELLSALMLDFLDTTTEERTVQKALPTPV